MKKALGWILTPFCGLFFIFSLLFSHVIQFLGLHLFGYKGQKFGADLLGRMLLYSLKFVGASWDLPKLPATLSTNKPIIVISNHQSLFDVSVLIMLFARHHAKFVSKIELSNGIPGISYNLRHSGAALIDRKKPEQALPELKKFGKFIEDNNYCGCIFPEGTRAVDGKIKPFKSRGLSTILHNSPNAVILPVALEGLWEIVMFNYLPIPFGVKIKATILEPVEREGKSYDDMVLECEYKIRKQLNQLDGMELPAEKKK
jgi:1-acyl-sn-glycerol-3-phosphate acyltransferase